MDRVKDKALVGAYAVLLHPKSIGQIRLHSTDPFDPPLIDPKMMEDERDADVLAEGLELLLKIAKTPEMAKHGYEIAEDGLAECEQYKPTWTREYLSCHARERLLALFHPIGTCRMGAAGENSVVDERLR